jgi:hypothetical protein
MSWTYPFNEEQLQPHLSVPRTPSKTSTRSDQPITDHPPPITNHLPPITNHPVLIPWVYKTIAPQLPQSQSQPDTPRAETPDRSRLEFDIQSMFFFSFVIKNWLGIFFSYILYRVATPQVWSKRFDPKLTHLVRALVISAAEPILTEKDLEPFTELVHLFFEDCDFNSPLDHLPPSLKTLYIGGTFNQNLNRLPRGLEILSCSGAFDRPLFNLPPNLKYLTLHGYFNRKLENLPPGLIDLSLGICFQGPIEGPLPKSLQRATFHTVETSEIKLADFPPIKLSPQSKVVFRLPNAFYPKGSIECSYFVLS